MPALSDDGARFRARLGRVTGQGRAARASSSTALRALGIACAIALVLRVTYVLVVPDFDGDAYAHYEFAARVVASPSDLTVHWVWLPGFHFLLAGLQTIGATFRDVRIFNAMLSAAGPFLLHRHVARHSSPNVARTAALLWTVSSLGNLLGTTALAEVSFTLLLLGASVEMDLPRGRGRTAWAGLLLAGACSMRYEAWFAVMLLGGWQIASRWPRLGRWIAVSPAPPLVVAVPAVAIATYVVVRRFVDHEWLWFVRETYRFTHMQRGLITSSPVLQALWFPVILPTLLLGPAIALLPFGRRRDEHTTPAPAAASTLIPVAMVAFLALSWLGRGALAQPRYFTALMPFACALLAKAVPVVASRMRRGEASLASLVIASVLVTTVAWGAVTARSARHRHADLRAREARADGMRGR